MSKQHKLEVEKREVTKKRDLKILRKDGKIPGVFYSHDSKASINFIIDKSEINQAIKSDANIFTINVGGKERNVLFKSVQYHPLTEEMTHIDLYGVNMNKPVVVRVPIELRGDSVGVKEEGGVVNQASLEIEVKCLPGDIPNVIFADISELSIGDTLLAESLDLDEKLELISSNDMLIVSITLPMQEVEAVEEIDEELEEGAEPSDDSASESSDDSVSESSDENKEGSN